MANEILNNLMSIKQRIDARKAELETELKELEAAKERYAAGNYEKPIEEINFNMGNVKAELNKPYFADSEYRTASIAYVEAITAEAAASLKANEAAIIAAENAVAAANANLRAAREQTGDIKGEVLNKLDNVGLGGVIHNAVGSPPDFILEAYKRLCNNYN